MRKLHQIGIGVLCLFTLFAAPFTSAAQDTEPPVVLSAVANPGGGIILVIFNESLDPASSQDVFNYSIDEGGGNVFSPVFVGAGPNNHAIFLFLNQALDPQQSNTLITSGICDLAGNCSSERRTAITYDTTPPEVVSAVAGCDGLTVTVSYSEPVEPFSASDAFNYLIFGSQGNFVAIINAFMVDSQTVLLQVDAGTPLVSENSYTLDVSTIMDLVGNPMMGIVTVPIEFDTTPPVVTCSVAISALFPANNMLVNVGLAAATDSSGSPAQVRVYSDEPELPSLADATYQNGVLELRARRNPSADGRVYLIIVTSADDCGNVGACCTTVVVPKNGSAAALSSVQAQAAAAQGQCSPTGSPVTPHLILP